MDILRQFEKETGIKITYDSVESNDLLEAKLLTGNSGWDIVFPSSSPYLVRQIRNKCFMQLDKKMIPNLKNLDLISLEQGKRIDPNLMYSIPYTWGTMGFVIDEEGLTKVIEKKFLDSYALLFDVEVTKKIKDCGISLLPEVDDVFSVLLHYLKLPSHTTDMKIINKAFKHLVKLKPYIRKFTASRAVNDIVMGELMVAQCWSYEGIRAEEEALEVGKKLRYVLPKEGTLIWSDHVAIPKDAPHPKEAFAFINFILKPEIAARVTEETGSGTSVKDSKKYLKDPHPAVFPSKEYLAKCYFENVSERIKKPGFDRQMSALWSLFRYS
jgi:putrescine transport system substrate-binding protein